MTKKQLQEALKAAVLGLRALRGMTGTVRERDTQIAATGYRIADKLDLGDVGYHPLDVIENRLNSKKADGPKTARPLGAPRRAAR